MNSPRNLQSNKAAGFRPATTTQRASQMLACWDWGVDAFGNQLAWHFGHTAVQVAICIFLFLGLVLGPPLARALDWRPSGTILAIWGLGGALSVTFISRIGRNDFMLDPATVGQCLSGLTKPWLSADSVLNLVMLLPLGAGLMLASRRYSVALTGVVAVSVGIELMQAISGLGACERGDIVRNTIGGVVGIALVRLAKLASKSNRQPASLPSATAPLSQHLPGQRNASAAQTPDQGNASAAVSRPEPLHWRRFPEGHQAPPESGPQQSPQPPT